MSAPMMHDPLVVNTRDDATWVRRAVTPEGRGLYALAGSVAGVPDQVLVSLAQLAEHGICGSADVLPMPVGPEPLVDADRAKAPWGRDEDGRPLLGPGAHWTDVPELVDQELARIRGRVGQAQSGHWYVASDTETRFVPGTVRTNVDGYQRTVGRVTNMGSADLDLVLHAHGDLSWCLEMVAKFRARVASLELERRSTNEALDDAVQALRAEPERLSYAKRARRESSPAKRQAWLMLARVEESERVADALLTPEAARSTDRLTRLLEPSQALREDVPAHPAPCRFPKSPGCTCRLTGAELDV